MRNNKKYRTWVNLTQMKSLATQVEKSTLEILKPPAQGQVVFKLLKDFKQLRTQLATITRWYFYKPAIN
jgi:hypothetical protein